MSLSDCPKCWDTPCTCGYGYATWPEARRLELARAALPAGYVVVREGESADLWRFVAAHDERERLDRAPAAAETLRPLMAARDAARAARAALPEPPGGGDDRCDSLTGSRAQRSAPPGSKSSTPSRPAR